MDFASKKFRQRIYLKIIKDRKVEENREKRKEEKNNLFVRGTPVVNTYM